MTDHAKVVARLAELRAIAEAAIGSPATNLAAWWAPRTTLRWIEWADEIRAQHGPGSLCEAGCDQWRRLAQVLEEQVP